jgi:HlyD family secretion protein|tara:strand:+ start:1238 stop:2482 length:1245 start_codon:yes stop_codon:yes gene_type:complete
MNTITPQDNPSNVDETLMKSIDITRPIYSYVLIGIIITCLIAVIWSIFGSIPQRVEGVGMIDTVEGLERVTSISNGRISEVKVKLNDQVKAGDVLFIIAMPERKYSIDQMELSIGQLKQKKNITFSGNTKSTLIKKKSDELSELSLKKNIEEINKSIIFYTKRVVEEKKLLDKGLITYAQYFSVQQDLASMKMNKISTEEQLNLISLNRNEWNLNNNINEIDLSSQLTALEVELADLIEEYKFETEVTAKTSGFVRQINIKKGDIVSPEYILAIINANEDKKSYILNLYVPFTTNAFISKGMDVDVELFSADPNLYGYLKGSVKYVAPYISETEGLQNVLENNSLIKYLDAKGGVYKIIVDLETDPNTFSGFKWSNKKGPPMKIHPGQLSAAYVNVKVKAPIDYVLPIFNAYFN